MFIKAGGLSAAGAALILAPLVPTWVVVSLLATVALIGLAVFVIHGGFWLRIRDAVPSGSSFAETQPSPLLMKETAVCLWDGITVGFLPNGRPLVFRGQDTSILVAGETRSGKTVFLNNIIAGAALDPRVQIALFDGKGANTFRRWESVADKFDRSGSAGALLTYLTSVLYEIERRYDRLADLDQEKLTKELYLTEMPLFLIVIDELANYTTPYPNKKLGQGVVSALAQIAAKGAGAGVLLVMATQHPSVEVVPAVIRNNVSMRVAFRVANPQASNIVLGQGMAKRGYDASSIARITERGIGFADIDGNAPRKFRSCLVEYSDTKPIAERAYAIRSGVPLERLQEIPVSPGDDEALPSRSLADDIRYVWRGAERLHNSVILQRLQRLDPNYYGPWSAQLFGRRLRDAGLAKFKSQWSEKENGRINHWGLTKDWLEATLEPDDGTTPSERRREREEMAMEALDEIGLLAYEARVAEIERATNCEYCDADLGPDNPATVDHWQPLAKTGQQGVPANLFNSPTNMFAACSSCNSSKRDKDPIVWLKHRRRVA